MAPSILEGVILLSTLWDNDLRFTPKYLDIPWYLTNCISTHYAH